MPIVNGTSGVNQQPLRYERTEQGWFVVYEWQGTRDAILAQTTVVEANGGLCELQQGYSGAADRLIARFSYQNDPQEVPINNWELFGTQAEKPLLSSDNEIVNALTLEQKQRITDAVEDSTVPITSDEEILLAELMLAGFTTMRQAVPTLRHTQTVSNNYEAWAAAQNVGSILSTASLISMENPTNKITVQINSLPFTSTKDGFEYGWFKMFPTTRDAAGQKTQIEQEWEFGLWPVPPMTFL